MNQKELEHFLEVMLPMPLREYAALWAESICTKGSILSTIWDVACEWQKIQDANEAHRHTPLPRSH